MPPTVRRFTLREIQISRMNIKARHSETYKASRGKMIKDKQKQQKFCCCDHHLIRDRETSMINIVATFLEKLWIS